MESNIKTIDLKKIELIKEKDLNYLSDSKKLERDLLPKLGFNNELLLEFPKKLYFYSGKGLYHWQYPNQFSKYLTLLSHYNIKSYLEIGTRWGGTFVITLEYLNKFHVIKNAIGVDIIDCPSIVKYKKINSKVDFVKMDTKSDKFRKFIKRKKFDLALIDGDHYEEGCKNDFELVRNKAKIIVFHDIVSDVCPGVVRIWNKFKKEGKNNYKFIEYIDQYREVRKRTGKKFLGIGIAIDKSFKEKQSR